jgi:hypothetical protein
VVLDDVGENVYMYVFTCVRSIGQESKVYTYIDCLYDYVYIECFELEAVVAC